MIHDEAYIRITRKPCSVLWVVMWGFLWFVVFNIAVWFVFDRHFFDWVGFDRLLMQPSVNELQSVIGKIKNENSKRHLVLLGDSIVWGVGVNDPKETLAGQLGTLLKDQEDIRIVNLAVPGNSFLDMAAQVREGYRPNDIYVFFINPMLFDEEYANRTFDESVRFKETVSFALAKERGRFGECCDLDIPLFNFRSVVSRLFTPVVPVYRHRDNITKWSIGLPPSIAVDAILHRLFNVRLTQLLERRPMSVGEGITTLRQTQDFRQSRMMRLLADVTSILKEYPNVLYVILNDNRFEKNAFQDRNIVSLKASIHSERVLSLYKTIGSDLYLDSVHMTPEGHGKVAEKVFEFLRTSDAI
ncbi:hypothetical protein HYZ98_04475 [Candidatus Peregrinibacteria bacterium]|nr:hypothetical protein [Candidatus Peregrinibacteria bacterium]